MDSVTGTTKKGAGGGRGRKFLQHYPESPKTLETIQMFKNRSLYKETMVHMHSGILLSLRKYKIMQFVAVWVGLERSLPSEVREEREQHRIISLMWDVKKQNSGIANLQRQQK